MTIFLIDHFNDEKININPIFKTIVRDQFFMDYLKILKKTTKTFNALREAEAFFIRLHRHIINGQKYYKSFALFSK